MKKSSDDQFQLYAERILDSLSGIETNKQLFSEEVEYLVGLLCDMVEIGRVPDEA